MQHLGLENDFPSILRLSTNLPVFAQPEPHPERIAHGFAVFCNEDSSSGVRGSVRWLGQNAHRAGDRLTVLYDQKFRHTNSVGPFVPTRHTAKSLSNAFFSTPVLRNLLY